MKQRYKKAGKRLLALALSILTLIGMLPNTASAWMAYEGMACSSAHGSAFVGADGENYYTADDYQYMLYDEYGSTTLKMAGKSHPRYRYLLNDAYGESRQVYCVESGVNFEDSENGYVSESGENSRYFKNLPIAAQYGIMLTTIHGWQPGKTSPVPGTNEDDYAVATQIIIWEYQQQLRTSPTTLGTNIYGVRPDNYLRTIQGRPAELCYNWILEQTAQHAVIPSFTSEKALDAPVYTLKYNQDSGRYELTLTDTNNTFADLKFTGSDDVQVSRNGNQYTFTSNTMLTNAVTLTAAKNVNLTGDRMLIWGRPGYQTMLSGVSDPVTFYVKINTETYGTGRIVKTSEDGKVDGVSFHIKGGNVDKTVTTNVDGSVDIQLLPGVYTVTEQTPDKYVPQSVQRVTIVSGQTSTVTFNNVLKRGSLKVVKTSEDKFVEGMKFHLYGTSLSGIPVDEYAVTDKDGVAVFENVLISGSTPYVLEEVDTPIRYVVPQKQNAAIEWNKVTGKSFANILKKFNVTVIKSDKETGTPQGDASLAGAVYGIYKGDSLVDTYTTDADGGFTTKYYVCGDDWTVREISPSEGYLLDTTIHPVGASAKNFVIERNNLAMDVNEQVIKGTVAIIKHTDDGETQIETPESDAVFQIYLSKAGSFDKAKETERDTLTCDENGFAKSKELPYGVYTVHQVSGWDGRELMDDFKVYIAEDSQTYRYLVNNANFESHIKIVKVDAETGNAIPYAGAGFQIYDPSGNLVTQTFTYPEVTTIDTFYTTEDGCLITPEKLPYGKDYSLVEVQAPYSYVLDSTPVYFDITEENSTEESGITIIKVDKPNMSQKGIIKIAKTGEVFSTVSGDKGIYQPVYSIQGLPGAVYEIKAAEDIVTLDGTLRAAKGEAVDIITTDETGNAESKELYLGKYEITEITAPYGMVLNTEVKTVELVYAGQEVSVTETAASFYNERQKAEIELEKLMEWDEAFEIGMNNEMASVAFGLYAAEDIPAADGTVIPADGLLEVVSLDGDGYGTARTDLPIGNYYFKETSTNAAYLLTNEKYPVIFEYEGQETALVTISANEGDVIENTLKRGKVQGIKKDEDGGNLSGAVMGLFDSDCTEFNEENAILTAISSDDGSFSFEEVPYGNWIVREIESPEGFVLTEEAFPVQIKADRQLIEIEIVNRYIRGNIQLTKVDRDYPDNKLTGAVFEIYEDTNGNKTLDEEDKLLGEMKETEIGIYEMADLRYGGYLVREKTAPEGFYLDENAYYAAIEEDGKTVVVENEAGKGFTNQTQKGKLKIVKTSSDGKVEGFSFRVTGANGYDRTFMTDENGEILIEDLRIGEYTISEVQDQMSAPYILPADKTAAVIADSTTTVEMHNELKKTPKTGDDSKTGLWFSLSVLSVTSITFFGIVAGRKNKKKEEG